MCARQPIIPTTLWGLNSPALQTLFSACPSHQETAGANRPGCPFLLISKAIPHNSKCRYGERGAADAKPKAQIILDAAKVSAASGGNGEPKQGQRSQSARGFCPRSTMRVPQPDIIEHFGNADAVPQSPERCLSRQAGIVRYCLKKRQYQPEKFSAPTGYYSASWNKGGKPKTLTLREWANLDTAKSRKKFQDFLTLKMQPYSDVLSVAEASRLTGYHHNTLTNWCHNGYIRYFEISGGYMIPKSCLLNFLLSPHILDSYRPSKKLVDLAKEFSRQGKSTKKPTAK